MKPPMKYLLLALLLATFSKPARSQDVIADTADILIGAIRWDWTGGGTVNEAVEWALGPEKWHSRIPFFGEVLGPDTIDATCETQECVDQEILYAKEGGLDYWAFLLYPPGGTLDLPLRRYLSSAYNSVLNFSVIGADDIDRVIGYFKHPSYQRVLDGRPLYFIHKFDTGADHLDLLRAACATAGIPEPYVVVMEDQQKAGYDGITRYWYNGTNFGGSTSGAPYSVLADAASNFWAQKRDQGYQQVPLVSSGTDGRPRIDRTPPWISDPSFYEKYYEAPTDQQLAASVQEAVNFVAANPASCESKAILIYAWNENDEGGWLTPTLDAEDPSGIDDGRLRAIKEVVWPTDTSDPRCQDASLSTILVGQDTLAGFDPEVFEYVVDYSAEGSSGVPVLTAISSQHYAQVRVMPPSGDFGETVIRVLSEDRTVERIYTVDFRIDHAPADSISWEFNTPGDLEGWYNVWSGHASISVPGTTLRANVTGDYPQIKSQSHLNINALTYDRLVLSMKNQTTSDDLYFQFIDSELSEILVDFTPSTSDTEFHTYEFDLKNNPAWKGSIYQLSWLLPRFAGTGSVDIDYIRLYLTDKPLSDEAGLSSIEVDGIPLPDFSQGQFEYLFRLPHDTYLPPVVTASATHPAASISIQQATTPNGRARVEVWSQSGQVGQSYTIDFEVDQRVSVPYYYRDFDEGGLPDGWAVQRPGYSAMVNAGAFMLNVDKSAADQAYVLADLYVTDFDLRPYMTISYRATDSLELELRLFGPGGSSEAELFSLASGNEWMSRTLNLSALASEEWGYDLDSMQLLFQPGDAAYQGSFILDEIMIADSVRGKVFKLRVEQPPPIELDLGADTAIREGETLVLDAGNPGSSCLWSTGETTRQIEVDMAGSYSVMVIGANNCTASDTIEVSLEVSMEPVEEAAGPLLYPNPNTGRFKLELQNASGLPQLEVMVLSAAGQLIHHEEFKLVHPDKVLDLSLEESIPGMYYLKLVFDRQVLILPFAIR